MRQRPGAERHMGEPRHGPGGLPGMVSDSERPPFSTLECAALTDVRFFQLTSPQVNIDMFWQPCGKGTANGQLKVKDIKIHNVKGTSATKRPSMKFNCLPNSPCENIVVTDSQIWRDDGTAAYYECN